MSILNPPIAPSTKFSPFPRLPAELRQAVWEHSLCHERWLHVQLRARPETIDTGDYKNRSYDILLIERYAISKLLRVNQESREAARRFYRVQLPCRYLWDGQKETHGTLYINPELDMIQGADDSPLFARFADEIWEADRKHVGLVNLATRGAPSQIPDVDLLRRVFSRLERVTFIQHWISEAKAFRCAYPGGGYAPGEDVPGVESFSHYRARPILAATTPTFDRMTRDPRGIQPLLKRMHMYGYDPRTTLKIWLALLELLQVDSPTDHKVAYQFVLAYGDRGTPYWGRGGDYGSDAKITTWPSNGNVQWGPSSWDRRPLHMVTTRARAVEFATRSDQYWRGISKHIDIGPCESHGLRRAGRTEEPQSAFGFWVFPIKAMETMDPSEYIVVDELVDDGLTVHEDGMTTFPPARTKFHMKNFMMDLSRYEPELCLSHLY